MILKMLKWGTVGTVGVCLAGGAIFGADAVSYLTSSGRAVRSAVKDAVPMEFELRRARDLVDELVPEMQAQVRLIAQHEVETSGLRRDIEQAKANLAFERTRVAKLRDAVNAKEANFTFGGVTYTRGQVKDDLARRFDSLKEAEVVLAGKERLLANRERSLATAVQALERTRSQKSLLEGQIASLESQHRLVQAAAAAEGAPSGIDGTKLAQAERALGQIKKQLDVAERVLAHESRFVQPIQVDAVSDRDLVAQVDEHLAAQAGVAKADVDARD